MGVAAGTAVVAVADLAEAVVAALAVQLPLLSGQASERTLEADRPVKCQNNQHSCTLSSSKSNGTYAHDSRVFGHWRRL